MKLYWMPVRKLQPIHEIFSNQAQTPDRLLPQESRFALVAQGWCKAA